MYSQNSATTKAREAVCGRCEAEAAGGVGPPERESSASRQKLLAVSAVGRGRSRPAPVPRAEGECRAGATRRLKSHRRSPTTIARLGTDAANPPSPGLVRAFADTLYI